MHTIRKATEKDAAAISAQRVQMFQANDLKPVSTWDELESTFAEWVVGKLRDETYVGWLVEDEKAEVVGGAGVWFMEWPPHFLHLEPTRGYLLNFYVAPDARRRGLASQLVGLSVEECRKRGVRIATLHASPMGRPVYTLLGWKDSNEMIFKAIRSI